MRVASWAMVAFALASGPAASADCKLGEAVYEPVDGEGAVIRFVPEANSMYADYAMRLEFPETGRIDEFEFTFSNGYSRQYAILKVDDDTAATSGPGDVPSTTIQTFNPDLSAFGPLSIGGPAPELIILPDLAAELWYGRVDGDRDNIPPEGLWRARCS